LDSNHTTGAEQQKTRVMLATIRRIGHLSATYDSCVMLFSTPCDGGVYRTASVLFVAAIVGKIRPAGDALHDWPVLRLSCDSTGHASLDQRDRWILRLRMIFSENRFPPPIKSGAGFFGIML
jgi:hypothetical protein